MPTKTYKRQPIKKRSKWLNYDTNLILVSTRVHTNQNGSKFLAKATQKARSRLDGLMVQCVTAIGKTHS